MDTTIAQLEELCRVVKEKRAVLDEIAERKKEAQKAVDEAEALLVETLKNCGKTSYPSEFGWATISYLTSVKIPQNEEKRGLFFSYLKEKGLFENMISVHSQTLNSYYKQELEKAREEGRGDDFTLPGLEPHTVNERLSFTAKK